MSAIPVVPTLAEVIASIEALYPREAAQSWDHVGLVSGDPAQPVRGILLALDPTLAVIAEAQRHRADLLLTHHPLLMRGAHELPATTAKGASVRALIRSDVALYVAHTNADVAATGVNAALAEAAGLRGAEPLVVQEGQPMGRVGDLAAPTDLAAFARALATNLPPAPVGLRVAGPPDATVRRVAVMGGAGDSLIEAARAVGADVYVTADLRHHAALEAREESGGGPPYLIDAGHWASESAWLPLAARELARLLPTSVEIRVSAQCTDPWTFVVADPTEEHREG